MKTIELVRPLVLAVEMQKGFEKMNDGALALLDATEIDNDIESLESTIEDLKDKIGEMEDAVQEVIDMRLHEVVKSRFYLDDDTLTEEYENWDMESADREIEGIVKDITKLLKGE